MDERTGDSTRGTPGIRTTGVLPGYPLPQVFLQPEWSGIIPVREHQKLSYIKDMTPLEKMYCINNWCRDDHLIPAESPMYPKALPTHMFLICGNRAWSGIPSRFRGRPCTLGRLSVLAPNKICIGKTILNGPAKREEYSN